MQSLIKRYERDAQYSACVPEGMLRLIGYNVDLAHSERLLDIPAFTQDIFAQTFEVKTGTWYTEDGWVVGKNPDMCPGMIISRDDFFGDIMVEATVKMVAPSTHDINVMIHGEWDPVSDTRGHAYVAGLEAFWHGHIGFERSPDYKLTVATQLFDFDPEAEHIFRLGNIGHKLFVVIDGKLCLEVTDPDPAFLDVNTYGRIGFEAFASWWKLRDLKVYRLSYERVGEYYNKEF